MDSGRRGERKRREDASKRRRYGKCLSVCATNQRCLLPSSYVSCVCVLLIPNSLILVDATRETESKRKVVTFLFFFFFPHRVLCCCGRCSRYGKKKKNGNSFNTMGNEPKHEKQGNERTTTTTNSPLDDCRQVLIMSLRYCTHSSSSSSFVVSSISLPRFTSKNRRRIYQLSFVIAIKSNNFLCVCI